MFETLFLLLNASVLPFWAAMVFAPRWWGTRAFVSSPVGPLAYAVVYGLLFLVTLPGSGEGGMGSLAALRVGFERDVVLLFAWVHYLAFDLFVGTWVLRDSQDHAIPHFWVVPALVLTLMLGPTGLIAYLAVRWFWVRTLAYRI